MSQASHQSAPVVDPPSRRRPTLRYVSTEFRDRLVNSGELTAQDWRLIDEVVRQQGTTELRALLDLGLMSEDALAEHLAAYTGAARWSAEGEDAPLAPGVPAAFMRSAAALVLDDDDAGEPTASGDPTAAAVRIVLADPSDHHAAHALLARFTKADAAVLIGTQKDIAAYLDAADASAESDDAGADAAIDASAELAALRDMASEAPVIRFFNQAVERAMDLGASDIHLERFERQTHLRYRVDGMLQEHAAPATGMYDALLCRVKILAGLDIAERRRAQDGRIRMRLRGRSVDMRVSIVPTMYGQDAAIRIQDRQRLAAVTLTDLGFTEPQIDELYATAAKANGILLITGPTGSGKTTTLYAILRQLASTERKVMTVEDPVEYAMGGVNQIQVNPAIDLTFSNTLRHILRHDPDVILVGEIRDAETAQMAFQAALTGHMVLSTLHTNDVPSTFVRLIDMGVEPYLVNAAVEGVSAQRLLRRLDRERSTPERAVFAGRVAVMEFSPVIPAIKRLILHGADEPAIAAALQEAGFVTMRARAMQLAREGVTTEAEVLRVFGAPDAEAVGERTAGPVAGGGGS